MNNAFLVHKPGVKKKKIQNIKFLDQKAKNEKFLVEIQKELTKLYGENKQCRVFYRKKREWKQRYVGNVM